VVSSRALDTGSGGVVGLIDHGQLEANLASFQVVDARPLAVFSEGHIPGARCLEWETWCDPAPETAGPVIAQAGYWGRLRSAPDDWYAWRLEEAGLRSDRPIVVYSDGPRSRGREGRIAWMLLYVGAPTVLLLDGGLPRWQQEHGAVELETARPAPGSFTVAIQPERRSTLEQLSNAWREGRMPPLVDTRSLPEYVGERDAYLPRRGHLPGAALVPFRALFDDDGRYVSKEDYQARLPAERRDADQLVAYCEVGVRAALFAVLHEAHSGQTVSVFDGSFMEWALQPDLPVAQASGE
jgi:thiosulfate/3-mercaptopyruvate sulfurtransferase